MRNRKGEAIHNPHQAEPEHAPSPLAAKGCEDESLRGPPRHNKAKASPQPVPSIHAHPHALYSQVYQEKASSKKSISVTSILSLQALRTSSLNPPVPQTLTPIAPT